MWSIVVTSLASRETINLAGGMVVIPRELDLSAYVTIFSGGQVTRAVGREPARDRRRHGAVSLVLTVLAAYGLSRPGSLGHRPLLFYFLLTFLIYPGLVPSYLVVTGLGLKDSLWSLILARRRQRLQPGRDPRVLHGHPERALRQRAHRRRERVAHPDAHRAAAVESGDRGGRPVLRRRLLERVLQRGALHRRQRQVADPARACRATSWPGQRRS